MSYLLDTHTLIWSILSSSILPKKVVNILEDGRTNVMVSVVSFWEIALKYSIGKLELHGVEPDHFPHLVEKTGFTVLPLDPKDIATSYKLMWVETHKDPFDRMLIWQALRNDLTIISKDVIFDKYTPLGLKLHWK